jgi:Excalibur calcium-binding domain
VTARRCLAVPSTLAVVGAALLGVVPMASATKAVRAPWKNCAQVNKKYPLYRIAMSNNSGLDRDKDGIACEKV